MKQTVLIVDDEKEIRELLRLYLEKDGYKVIQAENGKVAIEKSIIMQIDLAVIDIMMPEVDGYQLIKKLRGTSDIPIIIISAKSENYEKILGLDIGADDYVTKPFDPLELVARIKAQLRRFKGNTFNIEEVVLSVGNLSLNTATCILYIDNEIIELTATEFNMMKLFMQNPGCVYTKQQIYEAAWKEKGVVDDNTIMVAISKLRNKISISVTTIIKTIRGLGYRLEVKNEKET